MLDLMRRHARSWLIKAALFGVIIVFIFWYGWSGPSEKTRNYVAKVNDTVISYDQFKNAYEIEQKKIRSRFKGSIPPELLEKMDLKKNVIQNLVNQALLLQEAQRLGLVVREEDVVQHIVSNPYFQRNGVYDEAVASAILREMGFTPSSYRENLRQDLLVNQVEHLLTDAVKTDPEEIKQFWHFENDKLVLSVLLVKPEEAAKVAAPDAKTLELFFKDNQTKYDVPASLNLDYVIFSWRDIAKKLTITPEEAREYYNLNPREFTEPETVRAKHILLKIPAGANQEQIEQIRKKAEEIRARLNSGEDFDKVARELSEDDATREKGGDLGYFSKGSLNPQLERTAAKLDVGQISEPVRIDQGYDILMVTDKKPEQQLEFDAVKDKIVEKLLRERAQKQVNTDADNFYEMVYRAEQLDEPAKKFGFEVHKAQDVTRASGIPDVGNDAKIMDQAFDLKTGEVSRLLKTDDTYLVFKILEKTKERTPTLDQVRSTVEKDYSKHEAMANAMKKAEEIIQSLKTKSSDPDEIARKYGLKWETLDPVSRTAGIVPQLGNTPEALEVLTTVSPESSLFPRPVTTSGGAAVVRLKDLELASDEQFAKDTATVKAWVKEVRRTEFLKGWLRVMAEKSKIDMNEKIF